MANDVIHIRPVKGWVPLDLPEIWRYRDLLYILAWRDVKIKYKQALFGFAWAIIQPLVTMLIFGTIFGRVAKLPSDGLNPYIFYLAGLVPWHYFSQSLTGASNSLVGFAHLLTKIYLPRLFLPMGTCIANIVDFVNAFAMLIVMMLALDIVPAATIALVPLLMVIAFMTALGVGSLLAAMNVKYRDIKFVVPFLAQIWMYCTVLLPFSKIPETWGIWRWAYCLNPVAGVVEGTRWCLMHHMMFLDEARTIPVPPPWTLIGIGLPVALGLLIFGLHYFKRTEKMFADIV